MGQRFTEQELEITKHKNETYHNCTEEEDDSRGNHSPLSCNTSDQTRVVYGTHETQVSGGGEADLHKHLVGCMKNPGHTQFVPFILFDTSNLPVGYHDVDLVAFIKCTGHLTVSLDVKMTSGERPEFWPHTNVPYPFKNMRGSDIMRVGTGMVSRVDKWKVEYNTGLCQCHKCQKSGSPSKVWGQVRLNTATHVVFDDIEARHVTCRLFYDEEDSPLVTLDDWTVIDSNIEEDWCRLNCVTCDEEILDKLYRILRQWGERWWIVKNKYKSSRDRDKVTIIVSHPHGCPKQVSLGHWIKRYDMGEERTKYTYTTCTCPGSSGAYVHSLGYNNDWFKERHVHSGVNSEGNNFSGTGRDMPYN